MNLKRNVPIPHPTSGFDNTPWEVTTSTVRDLIRGGEDFLLLDCRTAEEWETAAIEGSLNLPLQQVSTRCAELDPHRRQPIIIYCRTGRRSAIVAKYLHVSGFLHVRSMAGGMEAWMEASLPTSRT